MAKISVNNLAQAIYESLKEKGGSSFDDTITNTVIFIKEKNMLGKKEQILEALQKITDKDSGIIRAKVSKSEKIKEAEIKGIEEFIKKRYKAKEVVLDQIENPKLLGGVKIEIEDEVLDMTLVNKLHQLKNYLITN